MSSSQSLDFANFAWHLVKILVIAFSARDKGRGGEEQGEGGRLEGGGY